MGKAILIILLSSTIMFSIVSLNTNKILEQATSSSVGHHNQIRARNIANSLVQMALSDLSADDTYRVNSQQTKDLLGGTVSYTVKDKNFAGEDLIQIVAESEYFGFTKNVVAYTKSPTIELPPPFLQYALASDAEITLSGNSTVKSGGSSTWNTNVHSNGDLDVTDTIEGFATYVGSIGGNVENVIPNYNPDGDPPYSQVGWVDLPLFNPDDFLGIADEVIPGDKQYQNETITLGTIDNPKIIYVDGNLEFKDNVTVAGYGAFVVKDETKASGGTIVLPEDPDHSNLALYSVGRVTVSGTGTFAAQIYCLDRVDFTGGSSLFGSVTAKGKVTVSGGGYVYYKPASVDLTRPFWESDEGDADRRWTALYYNE